MKIGVLGGTFNPIHNGHIEMARQALLLADLDEVWIMPAGIPPHKDQNGVCSSMHRMNMCRLACKPFSHILASDFEINSETNNYTYQTLEKLSACYPKDKFYFIMGQDSVESFRTWKEPQSILKHASLLVFLRGNHYDEEKLRCRETINGLKKDFEGEIIPLDFEPLAISSSKIRLLISKNADSSEVKPLLCDEVYQYIKEHRLYETIEEYDTKAFQKELKKVLKPSRYEHSLGVADTSASLAAAYGYPKHLAYVAGLLHDCAKYMSNEELLDYATKHKVDITKGDRKALHLLHAPVGAYIARNKYGIKDEDLLHAISVHTTGCPNMTLLDKIIFVADYIEPHRDKAPRLEELRKLSYKDINRAIVMILEDTINYIKSGDSYIDKRTFETYEYYKKETDHEY